ncbi:Peptidase S8/S53, subtilisin/kexin/sedolisin [Metarhizium guizhouense ARSEF 977]|uniref:Peptidase S8/S53, subtilisin/kexin/sedolisin n=1 Tax=Metarhizium guizhouense (strain ARSEF 977) TaxID=1276136 RepID=A0A0B4GY35_METGA|nr:Peptidase S8/S53, subtilisin/kexin/sedolisin [Metarhizium guizhouense ARSEF 977]
MAKLFSQAIKWAISKEVHVISMSWTIHETPRNKDIMNELKSTIYDAEKAGILLFCSVSDQGAKKGVAYPVSLKLIRSRAAIKMAFDLINKDGKGN